MKGIDIDIDGHVKKKPSVQMNVKKNIFYDKME